MSTQVTLANFHSIQDKSGRIAELADQCVMCGLCLPHCPTYRIARVEGESPRGRIALARALATERLQPKPVLIERLDHCLSCMSCESVCPSHVNYGELIMQTRAMLRESHSRPLQWRWLRDAITTPAYLRTALRISRFLQLNRWASNRFGQWLFARLGFAGLGREIPPLPSLRRWAESHKPQQPVRGRVGLFLGCVASALEQDTHAAAIRLLTAIGYEVVVPRSQGCCGALDKHAGELSRAAALAKAVHATFAASSIDTVLVSASGCFGSLRDDAFAGSGICVREIHEFLNQDPEIGYLQWRSTPKTVALHTPCTQANVAHADSAVLALLRRIPQLRISLLPIEPRCCGAAGTYFMEYPEMAEPLRAEKLAQVTGLEPDLLLTSNIGCRIYLGNGLRQRGADLPVLHPLVLLARQLGPVRAEEKAAN